MQIAIPQPARFFRVPSPRGYQRTCFFHKDPFVTKFVASDLVKVTGYIGFRYLSVHNSLKGVLFESIKSKTCVDDYMLRVGLDQEEFEDFEPLYTLEKLGVLMFKAGHSSILAVASEIHSSLLVRAE